jgi:S1-C subfamily serine protease
VTPEIADGLGLKRPTGALVSSVIGSSPAGRAGLKAGDLIVSIDGQIVEDPNTFDYRFATKPLGGNAQLDVVRAKQELKVAVALQVAPDTARDEIVIRSRSPFLGAKVANLSPALAEELRLDPAGGGVVIVEVGDGSAARNVGFQRGDVILSVNGQKLTKTGDLEKATGQQSRLWRITILRDGQQISVILGG